MAMQLKTGADLNNMPLSRFVIENLISDPTNNLKEGSKYYNAGSGTNSHRERIYSNGMWRSTAYMDDIDALQKQLDELDFAGSEEFQSLSGRVLTIEGLFNNGNAKNAEKLGGQLPSYYAEAEMVEQLREDFDDLYKTLNDDTTGVINTWQEVVDFVNEYSGSEDLSTILAAMNEDIEARALKSEVDSTFVTVNNNLSTIGGRVGSLETLTSNHTSQIADRYTKTETNTLLDAKADWSATIPENAFKAIGYGRPAEKWKYNGPALSFGANAIYFAQLQIDFNTNNIEFRRHTEEGFQPWRAFIHSGNYSNQITKLNNTLSVPSINIGGVVLDVVEGNLRITGNAYATGELASGKIAEEGGGGGGSTGGGYTAFDDTYSWDKYDSSMADWLLTAYHGNRFNDRINELEGKATNVRYSSSLTSGKELGKLYIDDTPFTICGVDAYTKTEANTIFDTKATWSSLISEGSYKAIGYGYAAQGFWTSGPALSFGANDTYYAQLQADASGVKTVIKFRRHDATGYRDWVTLLHSENVGDYALKKDGSNGLSGPVKLAQITSLDRATEGLYVGKSDIAGGAPFDYASFFNVTDNNSSSLQIAWYRSANVPKYAVRLNDSKSFSNWCELIHDGNIGNFALKSDGSNVMNSEAYIAWNVKDYENDVSDWSSVNGYGLRIISSTSENSGAPTQDATALHVKGRYAFKLASQGGNSDNLFFKNGTRDWMTLLHSGNYSDLITTLNNHLLVPSLKIGSTANYENPVLHVNGNMSIAASMEAKVSTGDGVSFLASDGTVLANICCGSTGGVGIFSKSDVVCFAHQSSIGSGKVGKDVGFYISADGTNIYGDLGVTGYLAVEGTMSVSELLYANAGVKIPSTDTLQIGDAIISYEDGALKVNKNFFAEGEVASGKVGEGTGGNTPSGSGLEIKPFDIASTTENQMVECVHNLGTRNVVVQIFEDSPTSNYQQVFADVYYVDDSKVKINFGAAQTVRHRVIIMG